MSKHNKILPSINVIDNIINKKIDSITEILTEAGHADLDDVEKFKMAYMLLIIDLNDESSYCSALIKHNIISTLNEYLTKTQKILQSIPLSNIKLKYSNTSLALLELDFTKYIQSDYTKCEKCGNGCEVDEDNSYVICLTCAHMSRLRGVIFREEQIFSQEGHKSRESMHRYTKHFRNWIDKIQAVNNTKIPEHVKNKINDYINLLGVSRRSITSESLRNYLKILELTNYNKDIPLLLCCITGVAPPRLTYDERILLDNKFIRMMELLEEVQPGDNIPYYPYFIIRLIKAFLPPSKHELINYIHMQSAETLVKIDNIYEQMCEKSKGEFKYTPS